MKVLTQSELRDFQRCRRKWWLRYVRKLGLKRESMVGNSQLGTIVHAALAVYYENNYDEEGAGRELEHDRTYALEQRPDEERGIAQQNELATIIVEGYFEWVKETGADSQFVVLGAEATDAVPLEDAGVSVELRGKKDLRVQDTATGRVGFLDHKVVGDLVQPAKREPLNTQFLHYDLLDRLLGRESLNGGWKNMLRRVKRTARAKPPFYLRVEHWHTDEELRSYYSRLHGVLRDMLSTEAMLADGVDDRWVAYPNPTRDCTWDCPYLAVCPMLDGNRSGAEEVLSRDYLELDPLARYSEESE